MAQSPSTGKTLRESHIDAMFKQENDSRNRYVILISCGYQAIPLNYCTASCPTCNSGKVVMMAVVKRGWAGYMFRVCRNCAWCHQDFASEGENSLREEPENQGAHEPNEF
jgi:hypothetical protein